MEVILNDVLIPFVNDGRISLDRVDSLVYIKEFIDRVTTKPYMKDEDIEKIIQKYGVAPTVVTWGDFFQTELAMDFLNATDEEFFDAMDAVRFDIIASFEVFDEKGSEIFQWIERTISELATKDESLFSDEDREIVHLNILKNYFLDMHIINNFTSSELEWFEGFKEAQAV